MTDLNTGQLMFVAAIVKGLYEHNDMYRHFGSTLAFSYYESEAQKMGLVQSGALTEKGKGWYKKAELNRMPDTRATFWQRMELPKP